MLIYSLGMDNFKLCLSSLITTWILGFPLFFCSSVDQTIIINDEFPPPLLQSFFVTSVSDPYSFDMDPDSDSAF